MRSAKQILVLKGRDRMKKKKKTWIFVVVLLICIMVLAQYGSSKTRIRMNENITGEWMAEDPEEHSSYILEADGSYTYKGRYELDGRVLSGVDTPGIYKLSEDMKKITFISEGMDGDNRVKGYFDEDMNLHIGDMVYHR